MGVRWAKVPNWECLFVHRRQGLFWSKNVDDIKMAGRRQKMAPMWRKLTKKCGPGRTNIIFLITYIWDAFNVNVNRTKTFLIDIEKCSNHEFLLPQPKKNFQDGRNLKQKRLRGLTIWKDMLKSALREIANWRTTRQSTYSSLKSLLG